MNEEDVDAIRNEARGLNAISSEYSKTMKMNYGAKTISIDVSGVSPEFGAMRNILPQAGGRFVNPTDIDEQRRVVFIGDKLAADVFGEGQDAVGKTVLLDGSPFLGRRGARARRSRTRATAAATTRRRFIPGSTFRAITGEKYDREPDLPGQGRRATPRP